MLCTNIAKTKTKNNYCTQHVGNLYFLGNSMNNLLSYWGLTEARMRASDKNLPVRDNSAAPRIDPEIHVEFLSYSQKIL